MKKSSGTVRNPVFVPSCTWLSTSPDEEIIRNLEQLRHQESIRALSTSPDEEIIRNYGATVDLSMSALLSTSPDEEIIRNRRSIKSAGGRGFETPKRATQLWLTR